MVTEEMKIRKKLCEFAKKYGVTKAAKKFETNRQFVYRQLKKYTGNVKSLALKSRRPKTHPNIHTQSELKLIKEIFKRSGNYGLAEVYVRCKDKGYNRSFGSMCCQIRNKEYKKNEKRDRISAKSQETTIKYLGEKVQIDIKCIPKETLKFSTKGKKYYQITAIDEYSRKRVLDICDEKSSDKTGKFLEKLDIRFGFPIKTIQVDNGYEFIGKNISKKGYFEIIAERKGYKIIRTNPYSPWQNGCQRKKNL